MRSWSASPLGAHKTVQRGHAIDKRHPFVNMQARSLDGGLSWQIEDFNGTRPGGRGLSADEHMGPGLRLGELVAADSAEIPPRALDFTQPDFALMAARTGIGRGVARLVFLRRLRRPLPQLGRAGDYYAACRCSGRPASPRARPDSGNI